MRKSIDACRFIDVKQASSLYRLLGDEARLRLLRVLRHERLNVTELTGILGLAQSGVSRHLRILYQSGFVSMRPDGQRRLYALKPERFQEIDEWLGQYRKLWEARLDRFDTAVEKRQQQARAKERSKKE